MVGVGFVTDVDVGADADAVAGGGENDAEGVRACRVAELAGDDCLGDPNGGRAGARDRLGAGVVGKADGSRGVSSLLIFLPLCHQTERGRIYIRRGETGARWWKWRIFG